MMHLLGQSRFGVLIASTVLLLAAAGPLHAAEDHQLALAAYSHGDYQRAAQLWQDLANQGDALAQYNLGQLYLQGNGVREDANVGRYWLSMASRQGLAQAYAALSAEALKPSQAPAANKNFEMDPTAWLEAQNPKYYTLQLASSTNEHLIRKYFEENQLQGQAGYYRSRRGGEEWYALVYGSFPTAAAAKDAIDELPADLRKWSPWVRNIRAIKKIMLD